MNELKFGHLKEGSNVYIRRGWHRECEKGTTAQVTKVVARSGGFYVEDMRFDMATGAQTNSRGGQPSQCWIDEHAYEEEVLRDRYWRGLKGNLSWKAPEGMSVERIQELAVELIGRPIDLARTR